MVSEISRSRPGHVADSPVELLRADGISGTVSVAATVGLLIAVVASRYHVSGSSLMTFPHMAISADGISVYLAGNLSLPTDTSSGLVTHVVSRNIVIKWFLSGADPIVLLMTSRLQLITDSLISLRPAVTIVRAVTAI